jgi:hypothetical protein
MRHREQRACVVRGEELVDLKSLFLFLRWSKKKNINAKEKHASNQALYE